MSTIKYSREYALKTIDGKDKKVIVKEKILDGLKGLSFRVLFVDGDKAKGILGHQQEDGKFKIVESEGKDKPKKEKEITKAELLKLAKSDKKLAFLHEYITKEQKKWVKGGKAKKRTTSKKKKKVVKKKSSVKKRTTTKKKKKVVKRKK